MTAFTLRSLLVELSKLVGLSDVSIRRHHFKKELASVSFHSKTIRLNKHVVDKLDLDLLRYLILHELVHLKLQHAAHNREFYDLLASYLPKPINWYDRKIMSKVKIYF